jgi:RNA polymerase sigma-70 factor (ECF subfamily)
MQERSDVELVQQVRSGNRQAFKTLMRRYQEKVYWVARRLVGTHEDADDVAQETFIKAYLALGEFRNDAQFYTWLYRIAVNLSLNVIRKRQVMSYLRDSEILRRFLPSEDRPDSVVELKETETRFHRAIVSLPEKQRAVFVLRFFDGLAYEDISKILNTSVGGLKANYFHAIHKIREHMRNVANAE